jgi:hypothetical protein
MGLQLAHELGCRLDNLEDRQATEGVEQVLGFLLGLEGFQDVTDTSVWIGDDVGCGSDKGPKFDPFILVEMDIGDHALDKRDPILGDGVIGVRSGAGDVEGFDLVFDDPLDRLGDLESNPIGVDNEILSLIRSKVSDDPLTEFRDGAGGEDQSPVRLARVQHGCQRRS